MRKSKTILEAGIKSCFQEQVGGFGPCKSLYFFTNVLLWLGRISRPGL